MGKMGEAEQEVHASGCGINKSPGERFSVRNIANDIIVVIYGDRGTALVVNTA